MNIKKIFKGLSIALLCACTCSAQITDTATLRGYINANIVPNGTRSITATILNTGLNGLLNVSNANANNAFKGVTLNFPSYMSGSGTVTGPGTGVFNIGFLNQSGTNGSRVVFSSPAGGASGAIGWNLLSAADISSGQFNTGRLGTGTASGTAVLRGQGTTMATWGTLLPSDVGAVPVTRNIITVLPLTGGGPLSSDLTLSVPNASETDSGVVNNVAQNFRGLKTFIDTVPTSYVSTGGTNFPDGAALTVRNKAVLNNSGAFLRLNPTSALNVERTAYIGALSNTSGPSTTFPTIVIGHNNGSAYNERMRIDALGRVGIGTASPGAT